MKARKDQTLPIRIGLELEGKRAARENCLIFIAARTKSGIVTSGTYAPTLGKVHFDGLRDREFAKPGTGLVGLIFEANPTPLVSPSCRYGALKLMSLPGSSIGIDRHRNLFRSTKKMILNLIIVN